MAERPIESHEKWWQGKETEWPDFNDLNCVISLRDPDTGELTSTISLMHLMGWMHDQIKKRGKKW